MSMPAGIVKWFSAEKGYGFITADSGEDYFVHHTAIQAEGFRSLGEGDPVSFETVTTDRGQQAKNVVRI